MSSEKSYGRLFGAGIGVFILIALYAFIFGAPNGYPAGSVFIVPEGAGISQTAHLLSAQKAVSFPLVFSLLVRLEGNRIAAGPYLLPKKENVFSLAYRFSHGVRGLTETKVTLPEGLSVRQEAAVLKSTLGSFDSETFIRIATPDEGKLFPDTYFFLPGVSPEAVKQTLEDTFSSRTAPLQSEIVAFGKPESDILTMASILEKEARQPETRRIVAGILWKRLKLGMPLQVDAAFGYIFNKDTYSPTGADFDVDSPYNTYKYKGLPPGPIGNPGIEAIEDAVTPIVTPYLYYVTDKEGNIYYAKTLEEHIQNIKKAVHS